jgi:hypothetical protein
MRTAAAIQTFEHEPWPIRAQLDTLRAFWRAVLRKWINDAQERCTPASALRIVIDHVDAGAKEGRRAVQGEEVGWPFGRSRTGG